ncbi:hypothetical protein DIURU_004595 [Diutina rugosa]|uniref:Cation efflux protein cytoplasmic domain-containing protein n=1 Tax=Diutina rugosa TaxID=5481 RepID=A0A642UGX6_DIURU|nr:uncharacterized protein DIURU_004595 [Diutina rugosa]KAA8898751.1 hypothetical protein DIURU_004595 [Diutina rugosa]
MSKETRIKALLTIDTVFFLVEAITGYTVHSLALVADSFHMLNDIVSLVIALWAVKVKNTKKADDRYTYGWQRAEILGALINAVFLLALCFSILMEAIARLVSPPEVTNPKLILVVGCWGLASNMVGLVLFHEHGGHSHSHASSAEENVYGHSNSSSSNVADYLPNTVVERYQPDEESPLISSHSHSHVGGGSTPEKRKSLNMEGVFLHVLGDALGNIGVIITALVIWKTNYSWKFYADPVTSLVITAIIFSTALPLCRKASKILLQATPANMNLNEIKDQIKAIPQVKSVHSFHVWNLNEDQVIASIHVRLNDNCGTGNSNIIDKNSFLQVVAQIREILHRYNIHQVTVQPEFSDSSSPSPEAADVYGPSHKGVCSIDDIANCDVHCK